MKDKLYKILKYKKDKCPKTNDEIDYWRCSNCSSHGNLSWVSWGEGHKLMKFTLKCGYPLRWGFNPETKQDDWHK
jgi:hypothetical protein